MLPYDTTSEIWKRKKYTLLWTVNQAIRQKITQKKTKEESKNGVPVLK